MLAVLTGLFSHVLFAQETVHIVINGDTIFSLSRTYRVSQEELMRRNNITDPSRIQIGMRLVIPGTAVQIITVTQTAPSSYSEYLVSPNETLYSIARNHGITLQALRDMNGFSRDYVLKAGERIRVPGNAASQMPTPAVTTPIPAPAATTPAPVAAIPASVSTTPPAAVRTGPAPRTASLSIKWPISAKQVVYMNGKTPGVIISGDRTESIKSLTRGTVIQIGPYRGYGNIVMVEAEGGYMYIYGACETVSVRQGDRVEPGTELGKLGIFPASGRPELVFMVHRNNVFIDPATAPRTL